MRLRVALSLVVVVALGTFVMSAPPTPATFSAGQFIGTNASGPNFVAQATSGPPLQVSSSDLVTNLNADYLNGHHAGDFALLAAPNTFTADQTVNGYLNVTGAYRIGGSNVLRAAASDTAVGIGALPAFPGSGGANTAVGYGALQSNTFGGANTAIGTYALKANTAQTYNTAVGLRALENATGGGNSGLGAGALGNSSGLYNIGIGYNAGLFLTSGDSNIYIGNFGPSSPESHTIRIGVNATVGNIHHDTTFITGIYGTTTGLAGLPVYVDTDGQLGTVVSSRRFKEDIRDMGTISERLLRLRPVAFRYRKSLADGSKPLHYGLIAEEVAQVFPELVVYGRDGKPEAVKYDLLPALLLNEFQHQNAKMTALSNQTSRLLAEVASKEKQIEVLTQQVNELRAIQERVASLETRLTHMQSRSKIASR